jgi:5'-3' exonuclease
VSLRIEKVIQQHILEECLERQSTYLMLGSNLFDGKPPELKSEELEKRAEIKKAAEEE